jgi:hypothetical protein
MGITHAKRVRALPRANRSGIPPSNVGLTVRDKSWGEGLDLQEPRPSSGYAPFTPLPADPAPSPATARNQPPLCDLCRSRSYCRPARSVQ